MTKSSHIFSIFGQIESVVADAMIAEKKLTRISAQDIPPTAAFDDAGRRAVFAVVVPAKVAAEFERRITALRV